MKKISAIVISVVLLFMLTASASADVRRGDRGEDVEEIQTLLFQMGWLFEEPDGIFGPHTEQAVINYQGYSGLTQDGVVDKATYDRMWEDWHYLFYDDGTPHNHGEDWDGDGILEVEPDDESMALLHNFPRPDDNPPETESEQKLPVPEEREGQQQIQEDETKAAAPAGGWRSPAPAAGSGPDWRRCRRRIRSSPCRACPGRSWRRWRPTPRRSG